MNITALKAKYFTPAPASFKDSLVTPLLDSFEYNSEIAAALATVGTDPDPAVNAAAGHFILVANWWLALLGGDLGEFELSTGAEWVPGSMPAYRLGLSGPFLNEMLKEKARRGVDVRVMGWVSTGVMDTVITRAFDKVADYATLNAMTIRAIQDLRSETTIGDKAILNLICHSAGGVHAKVVVVGSTSDAIGFTGGLDFVANRITTSLLHSNEEFWHDVTVKVEGPAVQGLYDWFREFWFDNLEYAGQRRDPEDFRLNDVQVPHIGPTTPQLEARNFSGLRKGKHHVQSLWTLPARNYQVLSIEPPATSFPDGGVFEIRDAWLHAIGAAEVYIYIEDQGFWSQEILRAIHDRLVSNSAVKVILVMPGGADPNDPPLDLAPKWHQSFNLGLLTGLTTAQLDRVRVFQRYGDSYPIDISIASVTTAGPIARIRTDMVFPKDLWADRFSPDACWLQVGGSAYRVVGNDATPAGTQVMITVEASPSSVISPGPARLLIIVGTLIHSKTTLIDDHWALVGSANCLRRSLYTDAEHSLGVLDEDDVVVKEYRKRLWAHHFLHPNPADFEDIQASLHAWEPMWGTAGAAPSRPARSGDPGPEFLVPVPLPFPTATFDTIARFKYDRFDDPDSRQSWGLLP